MKDELLKELKEALKQKDELRKNTITLLRAAILQVEKDEQTTLNDDDIVIIVAKEVKKRKEAMKEYEKVGSDIEVEKLKKEIEILSKYLPKQLTKEEIEQLIDNAIEQVKPSSAKDMGKIMKYIKNDTAGKADGKMVSEIVMQKLKNI